MKGKGPRSERETIINFNEEEDKATIWTASDAVYRRLLRRLGTGYLTEDGERHAVFTFPAEWAVLPRARTKRVLTPQQKADLAAQLGRIGRS